MSKFLEALKGVMSKEGAQNTLLTLLIGRISEGVELAKSLTEIDESLHTKVACRTLLDYEEVLRKSVNESLSPWDDLILNEAVKIAQSIVPNYVPVS